jgi:hypothetical protein
MCGNPKPRPAAETRYAATLCSQDGSTGTSVETHGGPSGARCRWPYEPVAGRQVAHSALSGPGDTVGACLPLVDSARARCVC